MDGNQPYREILCTNKLPQPCRHERAYEIEGKLVYSYLEGTMSPEACAEVLSGSAKEYNGYNLLYGDVDNLYCYSNKSGNLLTLDAGVYGLSNHLLDTPLAESLPGKEIVYRCYQRRLHRR